MSMDELLDKYLSQIVIENAGPDTTDDELLGTDYVSIIFRIPMAMSLEYQRNKGLEGRLDLVEFWKDTGLYEGLCSIAEFDSNYHFAIDALEHLGREVSAKELGFSNDGMVRVEICEEWSGNTLDSHQMTLDYID